MPTLVTVGADEKAVLISNESPTEFWGPGRHMIWVNIWKRVEYFPKAQQTVTINNISVQLSQLDSDSFKQTKTRGNFVAEAQIDITFYFEFADDEDLFATVNYAPKGNGSISDRISNLIRSEIMAKVASFASQRTWSEALWTRESLQKDLNENIEEDDSLTINQLKLKNCRVVITRLNLPPELKDIAKSKVEAEKRHIRTDTVTKIIEEFRGKFDLSKNTESLAFLLAMSGEDISRALRHTRMNFVIAPFIESLVNAFMGGTESQQEKALNKFLIQAEGHPQEVKRILNMQNLEEREETKIDPFDKICLKMMEFGDLRRISKFIDALNAAAQGPSNTVIPVGFIKNIANNTLGEESSTDAIKILTEAFGGEITIKDVTDFNNFLNKKKRILNMRKTEVQKKSDEGGEEIIDEYKDGWSEI